MTKKPFENLFGELIDKHPNQKKELQYYQQLYIENLELIKDLLLEDSEKRIYEYFFFLQGILVKTLRLAETSFRELSDNNKYSLVIITRTFYESWAALHYFQKYPNKQNRLIWGDKYENMKDGQIKSIHVLDMLRELEKDTPDNITVMKDYEEMSQVVHPNRKSHLAHVRIKEGEEFVFSFETHKELDEKDFSGFLNGLVVLYQQILKNASIIDDFYKKENGIRNITEA